MPHIGHEYGLEIEEEDDYDNEYGDEEDELEDMMHNEIMPRLGAAAMNPRGHR